MRLFIPGYCYVSEKSLIRRRIQRYQTPKDEKMTVTQQSKELLCERRAILRMSAIKYIQLLTPSRISTYSIKP